MSASTPANGSDRAGRELRVRGAEVLGSAIRARRKAQGMTLVDAAGLTGVGVRFLLELEHGKPTASLGKTLQVLERMGLELWLGPRRTGGR